MYFPLGWPKYLSVGQGRKSKLKHIACNRYRMLFAVITETTVSIWHCKPCVEIICYQRCHSSVAAIGNHEIAEWRQDSSMLAVTTTEGYLLLYQLEQDVKGDKGLSLYEYYQTRTNQGDSNDAVPALRLTVIANINYKVPITSLSCIRDDLLVTLQDGSMEIIYWEEPNIKNRSISLSDMSFSVDMDLAGFQLKSKTVYALQAVYSTFFEGFAIVLSDGRAALVVLGKSEVEIGQFEDQPESYDAVAWNAKGIWAPGMNQATCVAINNKYRLLGFGTKRGDCCVYAFDDVTRCLVLSHTIALSPTFYPNICDSVGSVYNLDWSPDGTALALSWTGGGLSIWSVFGACLTCTLSSDRAYNSDGTPVIQGTYRSMCWGVEGYHLWLVNESPSSISSSSSDQTENDIDEDYPTGEPATNNNSKLLGNTKKCIKKIRKKTDSSLSSSNSVHTKLEQGQLMQLQFVKSALAMNPCMSNHSHILLHSEDKLYLSSGERQLKTSMVTGIKNRNKIRKVVTSSNFEIERRPSQRTNTSPRRRSVPSIPSSVSQGFVNGEKLTAISEDNVPEIDTNKQENHNDEVLFDINSGSAVGNKQWTVVPFPLNYLPSNWPIRFAAVDDTCSYLAIAGNFGLAHYTVISRKWKVFGNVIQEKDMVVTGGLTWWEDFVVVACYDLAENQDEIRVYPRLCNLDNAFACRRKVKSQILLVNIFRNLVVLFTYDCRISIFVIARDLKMQRPMATLHALQEIPMIHFVPYPTLVVSVTLTALHMESATRRASSSTNSSRPARQTEVIIVNVAGRLLLLQRLLDDDDTLEWDEEEEQFVTTNNGLKEMKFTSPVVLASCVENIWATSHKNMSKVHLTDALWMGCGSAGVRVWLPLFPPRQNRHVSNEGNNPRGLELQLLTARRITLAFSLDMCYPLAVLFNEAVMLGVTSETLLYQAFDFKQTSKRTTRNNQNAFSYSTIERTCEIYLHQILRQLLRRNLGYHALQVAATCQNLSCFPHVLELMLHEVLEEEATASEPIPDPLLPTVIKFLEEFPEYLQTVVHCARKTEIALWEYLFNSVGSPRDLFQECFKTNQLQTAASYLIILQNLEQLSVARQDATKLFDQALQNHMWELANDIARFLRAIGDGDAATAPRHPTLLNTNIYPAVSPALHLTSSNDSDTAFKFSASKTQGNCSSPTADYPPPPRRLPSRSYTESFILPNKSTSTSSAIPTTASPSMKSSISNSFVPRYSVRQYSYQDDAVHRPLQQSLSHPLGGTGNVRLKRLSADKSTAPQNKEHAASDCAEHYFIDVILARQARKMLTDKHLHKLGTFAAYVDFQLVPWLKKERSRAARVDDPVSCFKALHTDFDWPYPNFLISKSNLSNLNIGELPPHSHSYNDLQTLQKNLPFLPRFSNTNFSPRNFLGSRPLFPAANFSPKRGSTVAENGSNLSTDDDSGIITILTAKEMNSTLTLTSAASEISEVLSETSYNFDDSNLNATIEDIHGFVASNFGIDDRRGPPRAEMKLQYLLELFLEARCLEWSLLICIMLKDPSYMARLLRSCEEEDAVPLDTLQRTRDAVQKIDEWAVSECSAYKAVLVNYRNHVHSLNDITNSREVAHAEKEAIKAMKHQSSNSSLINDVENNECLKSSTNNSKTSKLSAKKQMFDSSYPITNERLLNGKGGTFSESDNEESKLCRQGSLETRTRPKTPRTRHNSVPCSADSVLSLETSHVRTPSSPAKINSFSPFTNNAKPINTTELDKSESHEPPVFQDSTLNFQSQSPTRLRNVSVSSDSGEATSTSGSTEDDASGCILS